MEDLDQQLKHRDYKLYSTKAEFRSEFLKTFSSGPKIDPLSRRIAEIITQRELEVLGIKPTESVSKKYFQLPVKALKPIGFTEITQKFEEIKQEEVKKPEIQITVSELEKPKKQFLVMSPADLNSVHDQACNKEQNRKQTQEMISNLENLEAFKEELHRDYPELGLNNSGDGSSFHTNELNELEEACKDLNSEKSEKKNVVKENLKDSGETFPNLTDIVSPVRTEPNETQKTSEHEINKPAQLSPRPSNQLHGQTKSLSISLNRPSEQKELADPSSISRKFEFTPSNSKFLSLQNDLPTKDFQNLHNSYMKASFLHSPQDSISSHVPRCHVNLTTCKTTPIYFNLRVKKDFKVLQDTGIGQADTLRYLILTEKPATPIPEATDTYSKNLKWLHQKTERVKRLRESLDLSELKKCTFHPFTPRRRHDTIDLGHKSFTPRSSIDLKSVSISSIKTKRTSQTIQTKQTTQTTQPKQSKQINLISYVGLSPALTQVGYSEGCNVSKMIEKSLPMVDYKKVNDLD